MSASSTTSTERSVSTREGAEIGRRRRRRAFSWTTRLVAILSSVLGWAFPASAHVTVSPASLPKGTGDALLTFRVPNESSTSSVVGLRIQFPTDPPIAVVSPQAGSGWTVLARTVHLARPVTTDDGTFTSVVAEIDWTGGSIPVGQFGAFSVLGQGFPSDTSRLVFKAVQLYSDGSSVAWIQVPDRAVPDPSHPAPTIQLTDNAGSVTTTTSPAVAAGSVSGGSNGLSITALIVAGAAVVVAGLAIWLGRPLRRRSDPGS
jgi:periplasmic copper chaperone A